MWNDRTGARRSNGLRRLNVAVRGVVQGVGFRPFVYRTARAHGLVGWVRNESDDVRIEVQGTTRDLDAFLDRLQRDRPPHATIDDVALHEMDVGPEREFSILESGAPGAPQPTIPADLATCAECMKEVRTPGARRFEYPFTNCTHCGPRYSIVERLPYDRSRTSMKAFELCVDCATEFHDPGDRRFHAQPIACPRCGPHLTLLDDTGRNMAEPDDALALAAAALREGRIVAVKGLGGFQLLVDATAEPAVARLRARKRRPDKPLALMMATADVVLEHCRVSEREAHVLASVEAPIVLLRRRPSRERYRAANGSLPFSRVSCAYPCHPDRDARVVDGIAPGNPWLGVMLPYTPLHHLLLERVRRPIVCTSGNLADEPMCVETDEALARLGGIADLFLTHDRSIIRPMDDSVVRVDDDDLVMIRRARGYAPRPIGVPRQGASAAASAVRNPSGGGKTILAVGGHLKNTVALGLDSNVVLSPHIGDLDSVEGFTTFDRTIRDLTGFFAMHADIIACDLHPDYASTRQAEKLAAEWRVPIVRVQHHHAHVAAVMAEHGLDGDVLGLAWDGSGYGTDDVIWGGEALVCNGPDVRRVAHLRPFGLPGGDRAIVEPRRSALGLLFAVLGLAARDVARAWFADAERNTLFSMLERSINVPRTTSIGRLFDAVAALLELQTHASFEGQAAMAVEFAADGVDDAESAYTLPLTGEAPAIADWVPLVRALLADRAAGVAVPTISARFHDALARMAVETAQHVGLERVVLSGGCFQNRRLANTVKGGLRRAGFDVYAHRRVPTNDGGLALGQLFVAAHRREHADVPGNSRSRD